MVLVDPLRLLLPYSSADNPIVSMCILIFLQSLALVSYTYVQHVVIFIIVEIILFITNLLLFPTIQKLDRHLVMGNYSNEMKPDKFTSVNFKRWQMRAQLWLSAMGVLWVMSNPPALPLGSEKKVQEFTADTMVFVGCVLSILSDQLCDVYMNIGVLVIKWVFSILQNMLFSRY
jgi:hypothetical protein